MVRSSRCRIALNSCAAAAALLAFTTPVAAIAQTATYSFDIPAQDLGAALRAYARASRQQVSFSGATVRGKRSQALTGTHTADDALRILLGGSGLNVSRSPRGVILISQPQSAALSSRQGGESAGSGSITGRVVEGDSQRRLVGALVTIPGTGQTAITNEQGEFRFSSVPAGGYQINASFLGFPAQASLITVEPGQTANMTFLFGVYEVQDVIVSGQRSGRALALNRERTAENSSTVVSSDLLGNFPGSTISDALRRAPGVSFQTNAVTGDGTNITVRGLTPDYNQVTLNGVLLPDPLGVGRASDLSTLLADSVSEITISKTLLPNQDSSGTGGLVDISTQSPLDRPSRYGNISVAGTDLGRDYGSETLLSGTLSGRFGTSDQYGVSLSLQHRHQDRTTFTYDLGSNFQIGPYLPARSGGQAADIYEIDPRTPFPLAEGSDRIYPSLISNYITNNELENFTLTSSFEWQVDQDNHIQFDYTRSDQSTTSVVRDSQLSTYSPYVLQPVPSLNGAERYVLATDLGSLDSFISTRYSPKVQVVTDTLSLRGDSHRGSWTFQYGLGYSKGGFSEPENYTVRVSASGLDLTQPGLVLPEAVDPSTGVVPGIFGPRSSSQYPTPLLTDLGFQQLTSPSFVFFQQVLMQEDFSGSSDNFNSHMSARRDFAGSPLRYIEGGFAFRRSEYSNNPALSNPYTSVGFVQAPTLGMEFERLSYGGLQANQAFLLFNELSSVKSLIDNLDSLVNQGRLRVTKGTESLSRQDSTVERDFAGYIQGRADIGPLEFIGGVRVAKVDVEADIPNAVRYTNAAGVFDQAYFNASRRLIHRSGSQTDFLPRLLINYRPADDWVARAGYYSTVARPQLALLAGEQTVFLNLRPFSGPAFNQPSLTISQGNPDLAPAITHNFDLSVEHYDQSVGAVKLSAFYKVIEGLLEQNEVQISNDAAGIELPSDPRFASLPANLFVTVNRPVNNPENATIWGIEASLEKQLDFLPGELSGLSLYANYAYSQSSKVTTESWFQPVYDSTGSLVDFTNLEYSRELPFSDSPEHSYNLGVMYAGHGIDASLLYTSQAKRLAYIGSFGLDTYHQPLTSLDLKVEYRFDVRGTDMRLSFVGSNLLKSEDDPNTEYAVEAGGDSYKTGGFFLGGRTFTLGLSATF